MNRPRCSHSARVEDVVPQRPYRCSYQQKKTVNGKIAANDDEMMFHSKERTTLTSQCLLLQLGDLRIELPNNPGTKFAMCT